MGRKHGSGSLEKRGGTYYARWMQNGKRFCRSTGVQVGGKKNLAAALAKLDEFTKLVQKDDEEKTLEHIQARIMGVQRDKQKIESELPSVTFLEGWTLYEKSQSRPRSGEGTMENYSQQYSLFVNWLESEYPDVKEMRQVTKSIAEEYASVLLNGTPEKKIKEIEAAKMWIAKHGTDEPQSELADEELRKMRILAETKIRAKLRGTTFNRHMNALALVWRHVARNEKARIALNPWDWDEKTGIGIRRIKLVHNERPRKKRNLTTDEVKKLFANAQGEFKVLIAVGFYTGLRLGDAATLEWGNIDLATGVISKRSRKTDTETSPNINAALEKVLVDVKGKRTGYVMPTIAEEYLSGKNGRCRINTQLVKLFESVGIETKEKSEGDSRAHCVCGFHSLRHTFVTMLRTAGTPLKVAQALAGHHSEQMTEYYTHEDGRAALSLPDVIDLDSDGNVKCQSERVVLFKRIWGEMSEEERKEVRSIIECKK